MTLKRVLPVLLPVFCLALTSGAALAGFTMKVKVENKTDADVWVQQGGARGDVTKVDAQSSTSTPIEWNLDQCLTDGTYTLFLYADQNLSDQIGTSEYTYKGTSCDLKSGGTDAADGY